MATHYFSGKLPQVKLMNSKSLTDSLLDVAAGSLGKTLCSRFFPVTRTWGLYSWPFQGWIVTSIWVIKRSLGKTYVAMSQYQQNQRFSSLWTLKTSYTQCKKHPVTNTHHGESITNNLTFFADKVNMDYHEHPTTGWTHDWLLYPCSFDRFCRSTWANLYNS